MRKVDADELEKILGERASEPQFKDMLEKMRADKGSAFIDERVDVRQIDMSSPFVIDDIGSIADSISDTGIDEMIAQLDALLKDWPDDNKFSEITGSVLDLMKDLPVMGRVALLGSLVESTIKEMPKAIQGPVARIFARRLLIQVSDPVSRLRDLLRSFTRG
jgi:hypothetical protein